ncbi:MAG TPA: protoporphyrinogen oxidase [Candidatus Limnocylindria bacterium]|nr:protoporphyrinogen oxidase [Candidatus Limnocylindria bacterium]
MSTRRVAVIGAGVAGLAAALRVAERDPSAELVVLEAAARAGGTVATEHREGFVVELGADSVITEKPWAVALAERHGFADRLISTKEGERRTYVVHAGRLHPLPEGFLMLAPTALGPLVASPLFSIRGKLRMALDLVLPRARGGGDESLASFVRRRLGREALERAADPLVGGIYTADPERLSLAASMPRFLDLERKHRSVIRGLRAGTPAVVRHGAGARYGLFASHRDGMGAFVGEMVQRLPPGALRLGTLVDALVREGGRWQLVAGGTPLAADAVVVSVPAFAAARLLAPTDPELARALDGIEYASAATVTLGYRAADVAGRLHGFGFVVPHVENRPLLACTYASRKYPGRAPEGFELLRAFLGGARRPELVERSDEQLVAAVREELRSLVGITAEPVLVRVGRQRRAMPQYAVGHLDRVAAIERLTERLPGLALAGAAYRGVGIPDCIRSGELAADAVTDAPAAAPPGGLRPSG